MKAIKISDDHNQRMAKMIFASVYPLYLTKVVKKGRTEKELQQVIEWLTGFNASEQKKLIHEKVNFEIFFSRETQPPCEKYYWPNLWLSDRRDRK
jgi:hypothetical protein